MPRTRPYGLWDSPLRPSDLTSARSLKDLAWDSDGRSLVWLEGRGPTGVAVCHTEGTGAPRDLTTGFSVRARVGYGGGDFAVSGGRLYFVDGGERLYARDLTSGSSRSLTPVFGRPAAPAISRDGRWLVYVHNYEDVDRLAVVDTEGRHWPQWIAEGADFYMHPTWHPRGRMLAWVEWDHPQMPWDGARLKLGRVRQAAGALPRLEEGVRIVAGHADEAVFQPCFSPDGRYLAYVTDRRGWSDVWLYDLEADAHRCLAEGEGDVASPAWIQGQRVCGFSADSALVYFTRSSGGYRRAFSCAVDGGDATPVEELSDYSHVGQIAPCPRRAGFACIASSSGHSPRVLVVRPGKRLGVVARSTGETIPPADFAVPEPITWTAASGDAVHGLYYKPTGDFESPGLPPLLVHIHGGPTSQADAGFEPEAQYFATRGYAVVSVNHRGSTGYGRAYMKSLRGNWGLFDVEDAIGGARHLVDRQLADPERLVITGGSAGGYTVLQALTAHPGFFRAGLCRYGISDLFSLATDTHKFESRYLDSLLGPLPECSQIYRDRSPLFRVENIADPLAIFQGVDDDVVPRSQSDAIVDSLARRNVPHEYHLYEEEGHGFRKPETIEHYITAAELFLKQHVLFA